MNAGGAGVASSDNDADVSQGVQLSAHSMQHLHFPASAVVMAEVPPVAPASGMRSNDPELVSTSGFEGIPQAGPRTMQSWEPSWFGVLAVVCIIVVSIAAAQSTLALRSRQRGLDQDPQGNLAKQFLNVRKTGKADPAYREMKDLGEAI